MLVRSDKHSTAIRHASNGQIRRTNRNTENGKKQILIKQTVAAQ